MVRICELRPLLSLFSSSCRCAAPARKAPCLRSSTRSDRAPTPSSEAIRPSLPLPPFPPCSFPSQLSFDAKKIAGKPFVMDAAPDVPGVLRSPVFTNFAFPSGGTTQYADALLRTTFPKADALAHAARQAGSEGAQDRGPRWLRLHPHLEEDRRGLRRRRSSSFCKRNSSNSSPNSKASWSSP